MARSGLAALGAAPGFEPNPVLVDLGLRGMDRYQVARTGVLAFRARGRLCSQPGQKNSLAFPLRSHIMKVKVVEGEKNELPPPQIPVVG